ncbi:hypothetical protein SAMN05421754_100790 [Nitrosomonas sp. Nm58]|nr:hypothetical protein SAMN05421754_100790 [Nitrosomonas sp. Nm58]
MAVDSADVMSIRNENDDNEKNKNIFVLLYNSSPLHGQLRFKFIAFMDCLVTLAILFSCNICYKENACY